MDHLRSSLIQIGIETTVKDTTALNEMPLQPEIVRPNHEQNHLEQGKRPFGSTIGVIIGRKQFGCSSILTEKRAKLLTSLRDQWNIEMFIMSENAIIITSIYLLPQMTTSNFKMLSGRSGWSSVYQNWTATPVEGISELKFEFENQNVVEVQLFRDKELWNSIGVHQKRAEVYNTP
jgi:hypothetical protein